VFDPLSERIRTVKKLLSVLVVAGFLAGLGCGGDADKDKAKDKGKTGTTTGTGTGMEKDKGKMGKDKKDE
jgi:hypothetical protein